MMDTSIVIWHSFIKISTVAIEVGLFFFSSKSRCDYFANIFCHFIADSNSFFDFFVHREMNESLEILYQIN